jgi:S-adenosyl methyltransferase
MRLDEDFPDIDTTTASAARVYDYALGGTDNYQIDRQVMEALEDIMPGSFAQARINRRYLERVVRYLASECGIRQFIDNGSGLPTQNNVHEIAQGVAPGARVVYIDKDPVVLRHQKVGALRADDESTAFLLEDARHVDRIVGHRDTLRLIDFGQPVAVLYLSFLHLIPDADDPSGMIGWMMDHVAPGSYLALSHVVSDDPATRRKVSEFAGERPGDDAVRVRERAEVAEFFEGLEIVEPGLMHVADWRPDSPQDVQAPAMFEYGGVGRKPA